MIRTGIYGGSFNPIHNGHIALARQMLRMNLADEIWFVVSPMNPLKEHNPELLPDALRWEMAKLALEDERDLVACDFEFHLPKPSYTWNTLQALSKAYPDRQFVLVIGADNWNLFPRWYHHDDILSHYPIAIYPREGCEIDKTTLPDSVTLLDMPRYRVSSTEVRRRVREGKPIRRLVPLKVVDKVKEYYSIQRL